MQELDNWGLLDNWCVGQRLNDRHWWSIRPGVVDADLLEPSLAAFKSYRVDAANRLLDTMGSRPVLAVSGGVDSQAMLQSFYETGRSFDIASLVFKGSLNQHDIEFAEQAAARWGKKLYLIELDVMQFLLRELDNYADRYQCNSPQFACHHWFYEQLIEQGFTGIVAGGDAWTPVTDGSWRWACTMARCAWLTFARVNNFTLHGNFLASTWQLNFSLGACYDPTPDLDRLAEENKDNFGEFSRQMIVDRYQQKLTAFRRFGFDIVPQSNKFTGFEKVKEYFIQKTNDHWAFERRFRWPLELRWKEIPIGVQITQDQQKELEKLYFKFSAARNLA